VARSRGIPFDLASIPKSMAIFMLLAAGLRLGVLPLNIPYVREAYPWRGLGNVLRMVGPASSLVVLGRMPVQAVPEEWRGLLLAFSALAAAYGGAMWLVTDHELNGRPYWIISLAALAVASVVNGKPQASMAWGVACILSGSVLFFYSARQRRNLVIPVIGLIGITGLPFTPAASGWSGVIGSPSQAFSPLFLLSVVLLIWGYVRHAQRPREELHRLERWVHTIYPAGLFSLILAHWFIGLFGWPGSRTVGVWWASIITAVLAGLGLAAANYLPNFTAGSAISGSWVSVFARKAGGFLNSIFRLNWLYRFLAWIYRVLQSFIQLVTAVLEGDGGILWSLVILALLISLIWTGGVR
jgi:hypothetical protein